MTNIETLWIVGMFTMFVIAMVLISTRQRVVSVTGVVIRTFLVIVFWPIVAIAFIIKEIRND